MRWVSAARTRLKLFVGRRAAESRIDEELDFHIDMETDRIIREQGLAPDEARRQALATFGGVQQHRETLRAGRGTAWLNGLSLDLKLGFRMLSKYPGLTIVGGVAMAFGIWFGAVIFQMYGILANTNLPLPDGDRIVKIQAFDMKEQMDESRLLYDYQQYRDIRSITDLGVYRDLSVNLVGADGNARPADAAEITAAAFRIAPARPLHGRALLPSDEQAGATPVAVLGHGLWRERFASDPNVIGRTVRVGAGFTTIVGVMPEGYAFPISHEMWLPLRADAPSIRPREGFPVTIFGRLAPNASFESAQAEARLIAKRIAAEHPMTHGELQAYVTPYTQSTANPSADTMLIVTLSYLLCLMLVTVVCSTVALLLFARAASRETELIVRSALGASRSRIVLQLFAEALVLAGVATVVGLSTAQLALTRLGPPYLKMNYGRLPFWYDFNLSPTTIVVAISLAVVGAVIAGVMPGRKITRGIGTKLRAGAAGGAGVSFGGVWSVVIVVQIALTVAFPAVVMLVQSEIRRVESYDYGFRAEDFLGVSIGIDGPAPEAMDSAAAGAQLARYNASIEVLRQRLQGEPLIAGATIVDRLPRDYHISRRAQLTSAPTAPWTRVVTASIHPSYFDVLQSPIRMGRGFTSGDASPGSRVVIVDQAFVDLMMGGRNPVGQRVRLGTLAQVDSNPAEIPSYEIVGVVSELGLASASARIRSAGLYFPLAPGTRGDLHLLVRGRGNPLDAAARIREVATSVDPGLRLEQMTRLDKVADDDLWMLRLWLRVTGGLAGVAMLLSLSGIYAVLSYTVARRTREIGVRVALGASARLVITSIFRRPMIQVVLGVTAGSILIAVAALALLKSTEFEVLGRSGLTVGEIAMLVGYAILMVGVCAMACVVPTMRALRVQPSEALRAE